MTTQDNAADAQALKQELDRILMGDALNPVFQPIVSLQDGDIYGYEGLIRGPSDSPLHSPLALLQTADRFGLLVDVERACRRTTLRRFSTLGLDAQLFINVSPDSLMDPQLRPDSALALLAELGLRPDRVVIELTEMRPILDYRALRKELDEFKATGIPIAIDDLGEGFATLRLWSELRPNFVKIDKHFISGIHLDPVKQQFVAAIQRIASESGTRTIAEGIELEEELRLAKKLGLDFAQGYLLGRPEAAPRTRISAEALKVIQEGSAPNLSRNLLTRTHQIARSLLRDNPVVTLQTSNDRAYELFDKHPDLYSLPVIDAKGSPVGVVRRSHLIEAFARPYARELFGKKPCTQLMDRQPLIVDASLSLAALSQLVVAADRRYLVDGFIITDDGRYIGVGTGHDLMRALTELQISAARYANPLTLLPGSVPINERIDELIEQDVPFVAVFADLNHFKPFNDVYGYPRGDDVIQLLGHLLTQTLDSERDFTGHIGGDDFVLLLQSEDWKARCETILAEFDRRVMHCFDAAHIKARGYVTQDRLGREAFHPLVSLSLGAVPVSAHRFLGHRELAAALADVKKQAKAASGSSLFVDRRTQMAVGTGSVEVTSPAEPIS